MSKHNVPLERVLALGEREGSVLGLRRYVQDIIRIVGLNTQVRANMWRRNGSIMIKQAWVYTSSTFHDSGYSLDMALMQMAAVSIPPADFLSDLLQATAVSLATPLLPSRETENLMTHNFLHVVLFLLLFH